jgi:hypothetical protein
MMSVVSRFVGVLILPADVDVWGLTDADKI